MPKNKRPSRNEYRKVRALYLSPERCGRELIDLINRYAKHLGKPARKVIPSLLRDAIIDKLASAVGDVKKK